MRGKPICDYSSPENNATWICEQPPSKKCTPIVNMSHNHKYEELKKRLQRICKAYGCHVRMKKESTFKVLKSDKFIYENYWTNLPYCKQLFQKKELHSNEKTYLQISG